MWKNVGTHSGKALTNKVKNAPSTGSRKHYIRPINYPSNYRCFCCAKCCTKESNYNFIEISERFGNRSFKYPYTVACDYLAVRDSRSLFGDSLRYVATPICFRPVHLTWQNIIRRRVGDERARKHAYWNFYLVGLCLRISSDWLKYLRPEEFRNGYTVVWRLSLARVCAM